MIICRDAADLSRRTAEEWTRLAAQAVQSVGRFTVGLSGGSTPKAQELLGGGPDAALYPAAKIQPGAGKLTWLITADAAPK